MGCFMLNGLRLFKAASHSCLSLLVATVALLMYAGTWHYLFDLPVYDAVFKLMSSVFFTVALAFISVRFSYFFFQMLVYGRADKVACFGLHNGFNPINFLFLPRLLNHRGLHARGGCIRAALLFCLVYTAILLFTRLQLQ